MKTHLAPVQSDGRGRLASRRSHVDAGWEQDVIRLDVDAEGRASHLFLYACRRQLPRILATADGVRVFDFPIREGDLRLLVGPPTRSGTGGGGIGADCQAPGLRQVLALPQ